jgi:alpha-D-ribose 1-methylphosphonate 5-triphosphate synthase subunit PhnH
MLSVLPQLPRALIFQPWFAAMGEQGFLTPVFDAQRVFRALLTALSEPGRILAIPALCAPPQPLDPAAAALVLALCDADTPVWLAPPLGSAGDFIRFETAAPIVADPQEAQFVVSDLAHRPPLTTLKQGTPEYPDRASTLLLAVPALEENSGWRLSGPGIPDRRRLSVHGTGADFVAERQAQESRFPLGVDLVFVARDRLAALPRSTRLEA